MIVTLGNLYYYPLKLYVFISSYLYFRKLRVVGRENIPTKDPAIFVINHQNALLDALLLSVLSWRNPHFLTRADVFTNKLIDKFLRGLKMLPIYRGRDGYDSVKLNEAIFNAAQDILNKKGVVGIFPEGSHSLKYRLRPLKKGVARIAFRAEAAADFNLNLQIVPVGVQYESHFFSNGRTLVTFGKPVKVSDFKEKYMNDQNRGMEALIKTLHEKIKALILHFENVQDYDKNLEKFLEKRVYKKNLTDQLQADQSLVDSLEKGAVFEGKSDKKNVLGILLWKSWNVVWMIIGFIPKNLVSFIVRKQVKDPHFIGTMRFAYSIFLYPIIYAILYIGIKALSF